MRGKEIFLALVFAVIFQAGAQAQDTLRVMNYNLLFFRRQTRQSMCI